MDELRQNRSSICYKGFAVKIKGKMMGKPVNQSQLIGAWQYGHQEEKLGDPDVYSLCAVPAGPIESLTSHSYRVSFPSLTIKL